MHNHTKKLLCYTAFVSLLNMSFSPLHAGTEKDPSSQDESKGIKRSLQSSKESSKSEALSSHLSNRHSKRAIGDEFVINQNDITSLSKISPSVASLTNGNVFVAWFGNPTGSSQIYGRVFDPNGAAVTDEFVLNENVFGVNRFPSVAALTNGNVLVAWESTNYLNFYQIYGRVVSPNGTALTNQFGINQNDIAINQNYASVKSLINGNVLVAWDCPNPSQICGRVLYPNGTALADQFVISQPGNTSPQYFPSVASLTNGNVLVAWEGAKTGYYQIYGRVLYPNGTALTNEFVMNQNGITSQQHYPSVKSLINGNVLVAWEGTQTGYSQIYGRVFDPNGAAINTQFGINQNGITSNQYVPSVASLTNGNVLVAWEGAKTGYSQIYGRVFSPQGTAISNEFGIDQNSNTSNSPSVASLTNGNAFVAWEGAQTGYIQGLPFYPIYGRIIPGQGLTPSPTTVAPLGTPTAVPTNSAGRPTPLLLIPAKVVMDGSKILWNFATIKTWKSVEAIEDAERREKPRFSRTIETPQKVVNYVKSWFSSESWSEYFDSMEKSVLDYSKSVVEETPSYQSAYLGKSTLKGNTPIMSNASYNSTIGVGFLPYSVIPAIGQ